MLVNKIKVLSNELVSTDKSCQEKIKELCFDSNKNLIQNTENADETFTGQAEQKLHKKLKSPIKKYNQIKNYSNVEAILELHLQSDLKLMVASVEGFSTLCQRIDIDSGILRKELNER